MPRLYHTKSRTGCSRCRSRRVKCDENRPICGSCRRHQVDCVYDRQSSNNGASPPSSHFASPASAPAASRSPVTEPSPNGTLVWPETRDRRYRELFLVHFFTTEICPTLPGTYMEQARRIWAVDVPQMALDYEPLLNAILAVTILFMATTGYSGALSLPSLLTYRAQYLEATLQEHRKALGALNKRIADAASFTSVILSLDALANLQDRPLQPYQPPINWLKMCKGVMNVFRVTMDMVRQDPDAKINIVSESSASFVEPSVVFCEANRAKFPYLLERRHGETEDEADNEAYVNTVSYIGAILSAQEAGEHISAIYRRLMIFPILFPTRYVDLLSLCKPRALVILAHFFAVASSCSESWWVGDSPAREIRAISAHLSPDWQHLMSWPLQMIQQEKQA